MAWARLDDRFHEHWKVAEAGLEAVGLWALCLTWASQARRTSPTPGVVPESVLARFAGSPAKAKRLAGRLVKVGMLDARTDAGWPIHDFADYLPKYDADANRENGRRGGKARAAKQTASEPPSKPLEGREAVGQQTAEQTSSMRASARRNAVPVPSEEADASSAHTTEAPNAGQVVKAWIDGQRRRPPDRLVGQVAKQVRALLDEDFEPATVASALAEMTRKGLNPATLPSLVNQLANAPAGRTAPANGQLSRQQVDDILGPDTETLPQPPIDPEEDWAGYQAWLQNARVERLAERERQARARLERVPT